MEKTTWYRDQRYFPELILRMGENGVVAEAAGKSQGVLWMRKCKSLWLSIMGWGRGYLHVGLFDHSVSLH